MKSKEEIENIFSCFENCKDNSCDILKGDNWTITLFKPFEINEKKVFSFRLYGEVSGSKIKSYNNKQQWCGGADYEFDSIKNNLERSEYEHQLHPSITKEINVIELLKKI